MTTYDDLSAAFGSRVPDEGLKGYINVAKPLDGCTKIENPPNISYVNPKEWIALIKRTPSASGNCSFDVKVFNAQKAGYSAVIIYNSESDNLIKMSSSGAYNIKIPSVSMLFTILYTVVSLLAYLKIFLSTIGIYRLF